MSTPEGKVKDMVRRKMATAFPRSYRFMPVQSGMGATTLDFLYCVEGLFIAIETKAGTKKPTPRQDYVADQIRAAGGMSFVVRDEQSMQEAIDAIHIATHMRATPPCQ
jgi:hypothetical protein